jgi:transcriptional regulator with XRE-family HTH domain
MDAGVAVAQERDLEGDEHWRRFGAWLRAERERRGESRRTVVARGGLSFSTLRVCEDGGRVTRGSWIPVNPSNRVLYSLARGLELPAHLVFEKAGRRRPEGDDDETSSILALPEAERLIALERGLVELTAIVQELLRGRS